MHEAPNPTGQVNLVTLVLPLASQLQRRKLWNKMVGSSKEIEGKLLSLQPVMRLEEFIAKLRKERYQR